MKIKLLFLLLAGGLTLPAFSADTAFTYHGKLADGGSPPTAAYDLKFTLRERAPGVRSWGPLTKENVSVVAGEFDVMLDFGTDPFKGNDLQLEISARAHPTSGDPAYTTLSPAVTLTAVPYAIAALNTPAGSITAQHIAPNQVVKSINGVSSDAVTIQAGAGVTIAPPTAGGAIVISASGGGWALGGNAGTIGGTDFVGTTDAQALNFRVNGRRMLQLGLTEQFVAGDPLNYASPGAPGATVGGGGAAGNLTLGRDLIVVGASNRVTGPYGTVAGGVGNSAGVRSTVSGGHGNLATGDASVVAGGSFNEASGRGATVAGGSQNQAQGTKSFAAGSGAKANLDGSFVWASGLDTYSTEFTIARYQPSFANSFNVFAPNGVYFDMGGPGTAEPQSDGTVTTGRDVIALAPGYQPTRLIHTSTGAHLTRSGAWVNSSDQARKADFEDVDLRAILNALEKLPVRRWRYTNEVESIRHLGPVAQDFFAAFALGADDKSIATIDADGVALAAVKGLRQLVRERDAEISSLHRRIVELEKSGGGLLERMTVIERHLATVAAPNGLEKASP